MEVLAEDVYSCVFKLPIHAPTESHTARPPESQPHKSQNRQSDGGGSPSPSAYLTRTLPTRKRPYTGMLGTCRDQSPDTPHTLTRLSLECCDGCAGRSSPRRSVLPSAVFVLAVVVVLVKVIVVIPDVVAVRVAV